MRRFWIFDFGFWIGTKNSCTRARERLSRGRLRAFTLIELLIVVAMLSVLSGAFFSVVMFTIRAEVEEGIRSTLRQEGLSVVRSFVRDTHIARTATGWQPVSAESAGGPAGLSPAKDRSDTQTLVLEMDRGDRGAKRAIAYRLEGSRLERIILDGATTPTVQTLAGHVRRWHAVRSGNLVGIEMELAINRYTRDFTAHYAFATRVGVGQVANPSYRKE